MSKTKEELIDSLKKALTKNILLKDLFQELLEDKTKATALKKLRSDYPYVFDDYTRLLPFNSKGTDSLIREMVSLN